MARLIKKKQNNLTFTKRIVLLILFVALIDIQFPFVLAFLGHEQIAETLAITIVTEIIAVCLGYFAKAFLGKREEENLKFEREKEGL